MTDQPTGEAAVELQHKLEELAAHDRGALDVVVALLLAQFPSLFSAATDFVTTAADWLVN